MMNARAPSDPVRRRILALVLEHRTSLAAVSRQVGKNHAYLHQFIYRGIPRRLPELVRRAMAAHFAIAESELLAPDERDARALTAPVTPTVSASRKAIPVSDELRSKVLHSFAARLAVARAESPYGVPSVFADATGIDSQRYAELEDGEDDPTLDELDRIAQASGKSLDWLIRGEEKISVTGTQEADDTYRAAGVVKPDR